MKTPADPEHGPAKPSRPADLASDTAVTAVPKVPGAYVAHLSDAWSYIAPCGGVLMTIALRAMAAELNSPDLTLLSATTVFCAAVLPGDLAIQVQVLRRGDTAAQLRASLTNTRQPGPGLEVVATFAADRDGPDVTDPRMPDVPSPEEAEAHASRTGGTEYAIYDNLELRNALYAPLWRPGWQAGPAHAAYWYRYRVPQRDPTGALDPLAIPPLADTMPPALVRKLGPEAPRYLMPSLDLTVYFLAPTRAEWLLVETFVERARGGHAVGSANVWDRDGRLVARAAQSMTLRARKQR